MKVEKFKVVKRIPTEQYGFYEVEVEGTLGETDDINTVIESVKAAITNKSEPETTPEEKPVTTSKKKVTKKAAAKRHPVALCYDRAKEEHKKEFLSLLSIWDDAWSSKKPLVKKAGEVSKSLVGKPMFDKAGEILGSFTDLLVAGMED